MKSRAVHHSAESREDPFDTKGGAAFVDSLDAMVLSPASRTAIGDAVARGRHRRAGTAAPTDDARTERDASRKAQAS